LKNSHPKMPLKANGICVNCYQKKFCCFANFGEEVVFCEEYSFQESDAGENGRSDWGQTAFPGFDMRGLLPGLE